MGLKTLKPTLPLLPPRIGYASGDDKPFERQRVDSSPWRRWYQRAAWKRLRDVVRVRDLYTCQK